MEIGGPAVAHSLAALRSPGKSASIALNISPGLVLGQVKARE